MRVDTSEEKIQHVLTRGVAEVIQKDHLEERLRSGTQLRIKLGIDPTSSSLHLGRAVPLLKLRDFQEMGHKIILIVGDFTGVIGDTSDKESERPMLTEKEIRENEKTYYEQAGQILDMQAIEFRHNSEWLAPLTYKEIGEHADQFSVADFISRENIKKRLDEGKRVSLREVLYPLLQGYDSVAVEADVEVGGTDQKFNLLAGRTLQEHLGQEPQDIITGPLINGTDGRKMSSSWGNTIALTATPQEMYGQIMSMNDDEISTYFMVCTRVPLDEVTQLEEQLQAGENPRNIKMKLARELVSLYHNKDAAETAETAFVEQFQKGGTPSDVVVIQKPYEENLVEAGVVSSKSELRRLFEGGGIKNAETNQQLSALPDMLNEPLILKVGKRRFAKLLP